MAYPFQEFTINLGDMGLITDERQDKIPPGALIRAENITLERGLVEKSRGSKRWNNSALPSGILAFRNYRPDNVTERVLAVCQDGRVYKFSDAYNSAEVTAASSSDPSVLNIFGQPHISQGGEEDLAAAKKQFIYTGGSPIQVIENDGSTRRNLTTPAADWSDGNYPSFGLIHRGVHFCFGTKSAPHTVYGSVEEAHEDFQNEGLFIQTVYPGEGERIVAGIVYKGRLFIAKYPTGIYQLIDTDASSANWYFTRVSNTFGATSAHSVVSALDDVWAANQYGSITSMTAAFQLGDVKAADVLNQLRCEDVVRNETSNVYPDRIWAHYYEAKKQVYFAYSATGSDVQNRLLTFDFSKQQPKVTLGKKDSILCLGSIRNIKKIDLPTYGATDGFLYTMDSPDRDVAGSGFAGTFQTSHLDLGTKRNKIFQALEVSFEPTGRWNLSVDVYIDGQFQETLTYEVSHGAVLDHFTLDTNKTSGRVPWSIRKKLKGRGRVISFKCYNAGTGQNFKITALTVYFTMGEEGQKERY